MSQQPPAGLPDFSGAGDPAAPPQAPPPTELPAAAPARGPSSRAVVAVVVIAVVGQLLALGLVLGGVGAIVALAQRPGAEDPGTTDPGVGQEQLEPGQVHNAAGDPVEDGTGSRERPATPGEHSLSWPTWDGGTVTVRIEGIEWGAALPSTGDAEPLAEGYELVLVTGTLAYEGYAGYNAQGELWMLLETETSYRVEMLNGFAPDSLDTLGTLDDGEEAPFSAGFVVPSDEADSLLLSVETYGGEPLHVEVP